MGGTYKSHGNCSPVAEFNYWSDPDAALLVFDQLDQKIEMVGLDVTREIVFTPTLLAYCQRVNPEVGDYLKAITQFYFDFHWQYEHIIGCVINDPLAVAYFIDPTFVTALKVIPPSKQPASALAKHWLTGSISGTVLPIASS